MISFLSAIVIFIVVLAFLLFTAAWLFSSMLLNPPLIPPNEGDESFFDHPSKADLACEEICFPSADSIDIHGWFIKKRAGAPAIIFVHGWGGTRLHGLCYAPSLYRSGFNLLLIDLRNHGQSKSKSTFTSFGYYEKKDIFGAVDFLIHKKNTESIGIFGFSMGGASSIMAMAENKKIKAGIFEGSFANFYKTIKYRARHDYYLPEYPLLPLVMSMYARRGKLEIDKVNPVDLIGKIAPRPIYIIHGTEDQTVPPQSSKDLYQAAKEPRLLWEPEGAKHVAAWYSHQEETEKRVSEFFTKYL